MSFELRHTSHTNPEPSSSPSFTGKERDEETGYGYFGARYMDHELMTMWLSVDPMADKYPNISPYAYCAWNPVKLVDPEGRDWFYNENTGQIYYNSNNSIKELAEGGELSSDGWKYLCRNGLMYNTDPQSEAKKVCHDGGSFIPNKFDIMTGNLLGHCELSLSGKDAEDFANEHGFKKVPTQVVHYNSTYIQRAPGPGNYSFAFEMGTDIQLAEKYAFVRNFFEETNRSRIGKMIQGAIEPMLGCVPTVCRERINYGPSKVKNKFPFLKMMCGQHDYVNYTSIPMQNYDGNTPLINQFLKKR